MRASSSLGKLCGLAITMAAPQAFADLRSETGFADLKWLFPNKATSGEAVTVSQVEALDSGNYAPYLEDDETAPTLVLLSGPSGVSSHAAVVAQYFHSKNFSLAPDVATVRSRNSGDFLNNILGSQFTQGIQPEPSTIQSHAWISTSINSGTQEFLDRFDYYTEATNTVSAVGLNNSAATTVPGIFASSYNAISVGKTDGEHSRGGTPTELSHPGRQKPELVAPSPATSFSTGAVASGAAVLRGLILDDSSLSTANTSHGIKTLLMAGATRHEFPAWSRSNNLPLDAIYGAGELNILNSARILLAGAQSPGTIERRGWSRQTISEESTYSYTFQVAANTVAQNISVTLSWPRIVEELSAPSFRLSFNYTVRPLAELHLRLKDNNGTIIQQSTSSLDNIQHLAIDSLSSGSYTIEVEVISPSTVTHDFTLAWNCPLQQNDPQLKFNTATQLGIVNIAAGSPLSIERSTDLSNWAEIHRDTDSETPSTFDLTTPIDQKSFYRIKSLNP